MCHLIQLCYVGLILELYPLCTGHFAFPRIGLPMPQAPLTPSTSPSGSAPPTAMSRMT